MSVGRGAGYGFGGAMGVMLALVLVFVILPMVGCAGCIAIGLIGAAMAPDSHVSPSQPIDADADTEPSDSEETGDDDSRSSSSAETPDVSTFERPYHPAPHLGLDIDTAEEILASSP